MHAVRRNSQSVNCRTTGIQFSKLEGSCDKKIAVRKNQTQSCQNHLTAVFDFYFLLVCSVAIFFVHSSCLCCSFECLVPLSVWCVCVSLLSCGSCLCVCPCRGFCVAVCVSLCLCVCVVSVRLCVCFCLCLFLSVSVCACFCVLCVCVQK